MDYSRFVSEKIVSHNTQGFMEMVKKGEVEKPASLVGKEMVVFGNVHQIHDWHSKFNLFSVFIEYE